MSMHIKAVIEEQHADQTIGTVYDLGYWEGDPPAVGDKIDIDGVVCGVLRRLWVDNLSVRLLVARQPTEVWMVGR